MQHRVSHHLLVIIGGLTGLLTTLLLSSHIAYASTITVTNNLDSGVGSLRQVVRTAANGDLVVFSPLVFNVPQTITISSGPIMVTRSVTINGAQGGIYTPTLDGATTRQIMVIDNNSKVSLINLSFINGYVTGAANTGGGAIWNKTGTVMITDTLFAANATTSSGGAVRNDRSLLLYQVSFTNNSAATGGGAIYNGGYLTGTNLLFEANHSDAWGGAISNGGTRTVISGTTFFNNSAESGGAIYNSPYSLVITNSAFLSNTVMPSGLGGAISTYTRTSSVAIFYTSFAYNQAIAGGAIAHFARSGLRAGKIYIVGSQFIDNYSGMQGGAMFDTYGTRTDLDGVTFSRNRSDGRGGAMLYGDGTLRITNTTFIDNRAEGNGSDKGGGALLVGMTRDAVILNSTIVSNTANDYPPSNGVLALGSVISFQNSIVALNTSSESGNFGVTLDGVIKSLGNNLTDSAETFTVTGDLQNTIPLMLPLGDYGGPVLTVPLLYESPGIDDGNNSRCPSTDARGIKRPFGVNCDIGATETTNPVAYLPLIVKQ